MIFFKSYVRIRPINLAVFFMRKKKRLLAEYLELVDNKSIFRDQESMKSQKGKWSDLFSNSNPIILEIGMGSGGFLQQLIPVEREANIINNYIGFEVKPIRVYKSYRKNKESVEAGILKLVEGRANDLSEYFNDGEISRIHLNFSDPWPKKQHHNKRLTAVQFLNTYHKILSSDGELILKTDNKELFDYSIEKISNNGFKIIESTMDLHTSEYPIKLFITEFESKFMTRGLPIYYLKAQKLRA